MLMSESRSVLNSLLVVERVPNRNFVRITALVAAIFTLHCGAPNDQLEVDSLRLNSRELEARGIRRLGDPTGDAPEYATIAMTTKRALASKTTVVIPLESLPKSKLIFAAAAQGKLAELVRCTVTLEVSGHAPVGIAELELPAGPQVWVEAEAQLDSALTENTSQSLYLACDLDPKSDVQITWAQPLAIPITDDPPAPLIVVLSLDTLRADRVAGFGGTREMTPNLAKLGDDGLRLLTATSDATWTHPSHYALMTGSLKYFDRATMESDPDISLAKALAAKGYGTVAITGGGFLSPALGHHQGFDHFRMPPDTASIYRLEKHIALAEEWIERISDSPLFLFLHTYAIHRPSPLEFKWIGTVQSLGVIRPSDEEARIVSEWYGKLVTQADKVLGAFFDSLRQIANQRPVLLVVISDHGQAFAEHEIYGHGPGVPLYDGLTRIPIIVWSPGNIQSGSTLQQPTMLVDIAPSILGAVGIAAPDKMLGADRWPSWSGSRIEISDGYPGSATHSKGAWSLRTVEYKLIVKIEAGGELGFELYDLKNDSDEHSNIASQHPGIVARMHEDLKAKLTALGMPKESQGQLRGGRHSTSDHGEVFEIPSGERMEDATKDQLRALGYLE